MTRTDGIATAARLIAGVLDRKGEGERRGEGQDEEGDEDDGPASRAAERHHARHEEAGEKEGPGHRVEEGLLGDGVDPGLVAAKVEGQGHASEVSREEGGRSPGKRALTASRPRHRPIPEVPGALQHVLEERQEHEEGGRRDEEPVTNEAAAVALPARIEEREAEGDRDHRGNDLERVVAVLPEPQPEAGRERARAVAAAHVAKQRGEKEGRGEHRPRERQAPAGAQGRPLAPGAEGRRDEAERRAAELARP